MGSVQNADGSFNFNQAIFGYTTGDIASNYSAMSQMSGDAADVESSTPVGVQVWQATPIVRNVTTSNIDSLRVTVSVPSLTYQDPSNGNVSGTSVEYTIDIQSAEAGFVTAVHDTISGKTTSRYSRSYLIPLSGPGPFDVRVTRLTADSGDTYLQNQLWFDDFTAIVSTRLEYRHTALAGISIDAQQFSSIPTRAYDVKGLVINVPGNYDPVQHAYTGTWDGSFKLAWSDNPAWCFYDLLTNSRYGLGDMIDATTIDKWQLYAIGQYCDALVPDGYGGQEPRFTCNLYIQSDEDAYKVIQNLASIFRAVVFWSAGSIAVMQDAPSDPIQMFTRANVIGGAFKYQGTSLKSRHTVALVTWNDPSDWYQQKIEYVQDDASVAKYGVIKAQVTAFGCTSRGQAHRVGQWLLYSEQLETETVSFRCGMDGAYVYPGAIIQTSDPNRAGKRMGGRVVSASSDLTTITLDAPFVVTPNVVMSLQVVMPDGTLASEAITAVHGSAVTLAAPLAQAPATNAVYLITEADIQPELWRVVTISEVDGNQIEVSALTHNPGKYGNIENGLALAIRPISNLSATPSMPTNLSVTVARYAIDIGIAGLRLTFSWSGSAARYNVSYQKANGQLITLTQDQQSLDIDNVDLGVAYTFSVTAVSTLGFASQAASLNATITAPPVTYPADVTGFTATVTGNGVQLSWRDIADPMLYDYEIREGINWANGTSLGFFAGTSATVPPLLLANYQWMIKARDKLLNESVDADVAMLGVVAPAPPGITASLSGPNYELAWTTPPSMFPIDHFVIATGSSLANALPLALAYTTQYQSKVSFKGTQSFWVAAVDVAGNTGPYALAQLTVTPPGQPAITTQVIDNNVLLYWSDATQSLPVTTYQLSKGPTLASATVIGTKSGLFTTVFETVAGTYTYWIAGVDSAGNVGTAGSITATVNAPPDYVLHSDQFSSFSGTLSNAVLDEGAVVMPVDTQSSWSQHFTARSWNSPADQINAGFPIYAQPSLAAGYYEEIIDYGAMLPATNVTVTPTTQTIAGNPGVAVTISCSNASSNGPWVDYPNTLQVYLTNFRWIKVRVTVTSPDNCSLLEMTSLEIKLDVKLKNDAGNVLANAADVNGTNVNFNVPFVDVTSITVTAQGTTPMTALYEFSGLPYPKNFQVLLFNASGQRVSGTVSWAAKGY
ncbi:host specificity protein J [Pandoraea soli]